MKPVLQNSSAFKETPFSARSLTFTTNFEKGLKNVIYTIETPIRSGSGTPSLTNLRRFTTFTSVAVTFNGTTLNFPLNEYGCDVWLDIQRGLFSRHYDKIGLFYKDLNTTRSSLEEETLGGKTVYRIRVYCGSAELYSTTEPFISECFSGDKNAGAEGGWYVNAPVGCAAFYPYSTGNFFDIRVIVDKSVATTATLDTFANWLFTNKPYICVRRKRWLTEIPVTSNALATVSGSNTITASSASALLTGSYLVRTDDALGGGTLTDTLSCTVTEKLNGEYELEMVYPVDGLYSESLRPSALIRVKPNELSDDQLFRIYEASTPINGRVTYKAEHISYWLSYIPCMPFTASSASEALAGFTKNAIEYCPFTFWTDKSTSADYIQEEPASIRSRLGGIQGSIIDTYGGEYEWDNYTVKLLAHRGSDKGVVLRYGKNITDASVEESIASTITGIIPFWKDPESGDLTVLPERIISSPKADNFPFKRTAALDCTEQFEMAPTMAQLRSYANKYVSRSDFGVPKINYTISFIHLWQSPEYATFAPLERVSMGDTVTIELEKLGLSAKARVIQTKYNVLKERYESIELGSLRANMKQTMDSYYENLESEKASKSMLAEAIERVSKKLTGGLGGYKVDIMDANGNIIETRFMDTNDIATAQRMFIWNINGLGFSADGGRTYKTAWTSDGDFVADFITTGTLNANLLKTGRIASALRPDDTYWDLDTGKFQISFDDVVDADSGDSEATRTTLQQELDKRTQDTTDYVGGKISELNKTLSDEINEAKDLLIPINQSINDLNEATQIISADGNGIKISPKGGGISLVLQNDRISFVSSQGKVIGFISNDGFNLPSGVLSDSFMMGSHWVWAEDPSNRHLKLYYSA